MTTVSQRALGITEMPEHEKAQYRGRNNRLVSDDDMESALSWLRDSAKSVGEARARAIKAGHMVKHIEALMYLASLKTTSEAKKADSRTSQRWLEAINEEADAVGELEKLKALREAASARIEAWRSEQANYRNMKI